MNEAPPIPWPPPPVCDYCGNDRDLEIIIIGRLWVCPVCSRVTRRPRRLGSYVGGTGGS